MDRRHMKYRRGQKVRLITHLGDGGAILGHIPGVVIGIDHAKKRGDRTVYKVDTNQVWHEDAQWHYPEQLMPSDQYI